MVALVARQGRQLQRYNSQGHRLVVGCIPYILKVDNPYILRKEEIAQVLKVLVISSQKGHEIMFPKGGWESDETIDMAASREAVEEAGVIGEIEERLGEWAFKSKTEDRCKVGYMFPMRVTKELHEWPEISSRRRRWVSVAEMNKFCNQRWMKEALDRLIERLSAPSASWCTLKLVLTFVFNTRQKEKRTAQGENGRKILLPSRSLPKLQLICSFSC